VVGPQRTSRQEVRQVKPKQQYVTPEVRSIDSSEILEALGPAATNGGMSAFDGSGSWGSRDGRYHWRQSDVDPDYDG
jgi:hypothetical protein